SSDLTGIGKATGGHGCEPSSVVLGSGRPAPRNGPPGTWSGCRAHTTLRGMDLKPPTLTTSSTGPAKPGSDLIDTSDGERTAAEAVPRRVLVATDASPTSASAELAGLELSSRVGASLLFLSVIDPSRLRLPGGLFHTRVDR